MARATCYAAMGVAKSQEEEMIDVYANLLVNRGFRKEALVFANRYGSGQIHFNLVFSESDLDDYEPGNLVGQIDALSKEGYIKWNYIEYEKDDGGEKEYQIKDITLTIKGEELLRTLSLFSKAKPIIIGTIAGLLSAYLGVKFGFGK